MYVVKCMVDYIQFTCVFAYVANAVVTDVKQRRMFSPIPVVESQPISSGVFVVAQLSVGYQNTEVSAEEKHSMSVNPENLAASASATVNQTEDVAHLCGKRELIENAADSVSASVSQLSLMSTDDNEVEVDDAKIQQQNVEKSEITAAADEGAGANISSDDVSVKDAEGHESSTHLTAASEQTQLQQVDVNSQGAEAGYGDSPAQISGDVDDTASSRVSTYQSDVAVYKQEARTNDVAAAADCRQEARSGSTSETFTSCAHLSPSSTDSVFGSPQSHISDNKNANNNDSLPEQQGVQQHVGDTAMDSSRTKMVICSHSDSSTAGPDSSAATPDSSNSIAGPESSIAIPESSITCLDSSSAGPESFTASERRQTESECTQSMSATEKETESESSMNMESEERIERDKDKGRDVNVDDSADDDDDDDDSEDDNDDESDESKEDDMQEQSTVDKKTAVETQKNKGGVSMSRRAKKKSVKKEKEKKKKERKKKKSEQQIKQTQSAAVDKTASSSTVGSEADNVESLSIVRPPQMQSETMNTDKRTENEATHVRTVDSDANASGTGGVVNYHSSREGSSTKDTCTEQQKCAQTSGLGTNSAQVC